MKGASLFLTSASFRIALLIYVAAPLISALAIFGYISISAIEKQVEKQMQKDLELLARAVQLPLSYSLEKKRMGSVRQSLESVFSIGRVYSAYVYDKDGKVLFTLGLADPEPESDRLTALAADGESRGEYGNVADRRVYSYFAPLTDTGGRINGLLQLTRKESEFSDQLHAVWTKGTLSLAALLVILSTIVLYGHHRALGMHLGRLTDSMKKIASGERRHRFSSNGPREIVELGETFNYMLDSIEDAEEALKEQRRSKARLEKQLRQAEKLASLGRMAAGTAHELGAPLSVINGRAQRTLRNEDLPDDQRQALTAIREEVDRMEHIIKQLLDFSRSTPLRRTFADPARVVETVVSAIKEEAAAAKTTIQIKGVETSALISMDPLRIQQALINLLRNAVQSRLGGNVRLSWKCDRSGIVFDVDDDGPGVPVEIRSTIIEPFYTTKSAGEGTGLGLAVAHAVAEEHGGSIEIGDSDMGGAFFRLRIRQPSSEDPQIDERAENGRCGQA